MPSTGLPGPGSLLRRTLGERRIALVAWRLLVLQTAHPVVAAGMRDHSTYRAHPWRRVQHTMDSGKRLFSAPDSLRREVARLERTHRRIRGTDGRGGAYTAEDPEVRAWVLVTLYESTTAVRGLSGDPLPPGSSTSCTGNSSPSAASPGCPATPVSRTRATSSTTSPPPS